jgi:hypothetical protein
VAEHHIAGRGHELDGTPERNTRHSFRRCCGPALTKVTLQDLMRAWPDNEVPGEFLRDVAEEYTDESRKSRERTARHAIERCGNPVNVGLWDVRMVGVVRLADRDLPAIIPKLVPPEGFVYECCNRLIREQVRDGFMLANARAVGLMVVLGLALRIVMFLQVTVDDLAGGVDERQRY